jgi:hypothetical protein
MLADNLIDLKQSELMVDWCADVLDGGESGTHESSMTKVAVSEALFRVADRCVQIMGGTGVNGETIVEQVFREIRGFAFTTVPPKYTNGRWQRRSSVNTCRLADSERLRPERRRGSGSPCASIR